MKEKQNEIIFFEDREVKLEVNLKDDTVLLTQYQMVELFGRDKSVISRHINRIYQDGELEENSNCCIFCNSSRRR